MLRIFHHHKNSINHVPKRAAKSYKQKCLRCLRVYVKLTVPILPPDSYTLLLNASLVAKLYYPAGFHLGSTYSIKIPEENQRLPSVPTHPKPELPLQSSR